mmetsp:Transcript_18946/g.40702  ORF Transcript_18946/g.40702 Transcript_18946/m.40702 type:complete len:83 (+) Transcript_18946:55-303(+)
MHLPTMHQSGKICFSHGVSDKNLATNSRIREPDTQHCRSKFASNSIVGNDFSRKPRPRQTRVGILQEKKIVDLLCNNAFALL